MSAEKLRGMVTVPRDTPSRKLRTCCGKRESYGSKILSGDSNTKAAFPRILYAALVKGKPFSADFEIRELQESVSKPELEGAVFRDPEGRTRWDYALPGLPPERRVVASSLDDPENCKRIFLDHLRHTYRQTESVADASGGWYFIGDLSMAEVLRLAGEGASTPTRFNREGIAVRTVVFRHSDGSATEASVSEELKITISERWRWPSGDERVFRLFNILQTAPDTSLFSIPEGYTEQP